MKKKSKDFQLVIRLNSQLSRKVDIAAKKEGLKRATWGRREIIKILEPTENSVVNT